MRLAATLTTVMPLAAVEGARCTRVYRAHAVLTPRQTC
jgi:hypothetical protein